MQLAETVTGTPCKKCGGTERYQRTNRCAACARRRPAEWAKIHHKQRLATINRYNHSERGEATRSVQRSSPQAKEANRKSVALSRSHPRGRAKQMFYGARERAARKDLPFTITREMVVERLTALDGIAEVVADRFDFASRGDVHQNPYAPSLDQKIPGQGYTPENFQIVPMWYNRLKGDLTDTEALAIIQAAHLPNVSVPC